MAEMEHLRGRLCGEMTTEKKTTVRSAAGDCLRNEGKFVFSHFKELRIKNSAASGGSLTLDKSRHARETVMRFTSKTF